MANRRQLVEYQCYVTADASRGAGELPRGHEKRLERMIDVLERDPSVMSAVVSARARKGRPPDVVRSGYDATFTVAASSIMAASVTAVCALRNALDRADCEEIDVTGVELRRFYMPGGNKSVRVLEAAV